MGNYKYIRIEPTKLQISLNNFVDSVLNNSYEYQTYVNAFLYNVKDCVKNTKAGNQCQKISHFILVKREEIIKLRGVKFVYDSLYTIKRKYSFLDSYLENFSQSKYCFRISKPDILFSYIDSILYERLRTNMYNVVNKDSLEKEFNCVTYSTQKLVDIRKSVSNQGLTEYISYDGISKIIDEMFEVIEKNLDDLLNISLKSDNIPTTNIIIIHTISILFIIEEICRNITLYKIENEE